MMMYYPTFEEIRQLREAEMAGQPQGTAPMDGKKKREIPLLPLCCDILADFETPVSAYCKLTHGSPCPYSFLLESVTGGERIGRYSFIGIDPYMVITHQGETATIYSIKDTLWSDSAGHHTSRPNEENRLAPKGKEIPCHDPLRLIEAELGQYRLVSPVGVSQIAGDAIHRVPTNDDVLDKSGRDISGPYNIDHFLANVSRGEQSDELPRFHGGAVGYLSYETASRFEHLPVPANNELGLPLAVFCFTETVLVFDHVKHRARIVTHLHLDAPDLVSEYQRGRDILDSIQKRLQQPVRLPSEPQHISIAAPHSLRSGQAQLARLPTVSSDEKRGRLQVRASTKVAPTMDDTTASQVTSNRTQSEFEEMVRRSIAYIRAGDVFQVVPSQRLSRRINTAPFTVYRALRTINPSPYMFYLDMRDFQIVGASPELLVRYEDHEVTIRPIAGTRPRGADRESDEHLAEELKNDPKERAEHIMLVDLARNDVGRVSEPGSIQVSEYMEIERYSHVMHLVSNVTGKLREDLTPYDALRAGFPAGTVSGAPKIRAMEIISELEGEQRGVYAGAVGYFSHSGNQETAIALRTMVIKDGRAYIQAGCGVVADSDPTAEYQESLNKARALLRALDEAELIARAQ
jgi:anthranilate synthase component I